MTAIDDHPGPVPPDAAGPFAFSAMPGATARAHNMQFLRLILSALAENFAGSLGGVTIQTLRGGEPRLVRCRNHAEILRFLYSNGFAPILAVRAEDMSGGVWEDTETFLENRVRRAIESSLGEDFSAGKWAELREEMASAVAGEAQAMGAQETLYAALSAVVAGQGHRTLFAYLAQSPQAVREIAGVRHDAASLLMQIGALPGHRTHPCAKTRLLPEGGVGPRRRPLSTAEFDEYAPEAAPDVALPVLAVRRDRVTVSLGRRLEAQDYSAFFAASFPDAWERWEAAMIELGGPSAPAEFAPIPVHPLQLDVIRLRFSAAIAAGDILFPARAAIVQRPTISLRTFMPVARAEEPQVKTTLAMLMTNDVRIISPSRAFNGPVLSDLILDVIARDAGLADYLRLLPEPAAIAWGRDADPASQDYRHGFHLCAILRDNPAAMLSPGEIALPVSALFTQSPLGQEMLLAEIMRQCGVRDRSEATEWFHAYAEVVLGAALGLLLRYGIGLEAHQQNADMVFSAAGQPKALAYRDVSDIDIHEPMLRAAGFDIRAALHPFIRNLSDDIERPLRQTTHTTFVSHLFPAAGIIADAFAMPAQPLFAMIRDMVAAHLREAGLRIERTGGDETGALREVLAVIERRILHEPIRTKCLLHTRAAQTQEVAFTTVENPLAGV